MNELLHKPCIDAATGLMTVAAYDTALKEKKTIWTYHATPVERLLTEYSPTRVIDEEAYHAQMLHLLGLA